MIAAVVLAAGEGSRYGGPKQWRFLPAVLDALAEARIDEVVVVAGAHPVPSNSLLLGTARSVDCPDWQRGPGASLRCGLASLPVEATHALIVLADGPELDPRAIRRVAEHAGDAEVAAASYDGSRSHPVALARSVWHRVPDEGARALTSTLVDCSDLRPPGDVDFADPGREEQEPGEG